MADTTITIPDLGSITAGQASDLILLTRDTTGYKMLVSDLAKYIVENYNASTIAGSAQTLQSAIDSVKSNESKLVFGSANAVKVTGSLTANVDLLSAGFYALWSSGTDYETVGAPSAFSYIYLVVKLNATTAIIIAYNMGNSSSAVYVKHMYGNTGWDTGWTELVHTA